MQTREDRAARLSRRSLLADAGALTLLPFEGLELTGLAALAPLLSISWLADRMRGGTIRGCPVDG